MKRLIVTGFLLSSINVGVSNIDVEGLTSMNFNFYPQFLTDYKKIRKWEGNYAYLENDVGGETYGGIARNFNSKWRGWEVIDEYKRWHSVQWNDSILDVEPLVMHYYYKIWMNERYYLIKDEYVRNYLFDYRNTGPIAYKHMRKVLSLHGYPTKSGTKLDEKTIIALNKINPIIFILHLKEVREEYYRNIVYHKPEMEIFLKGWIRRAKHISLPS